MAHVHLLLSGLGKVHEIPVSGNGGSSFHCQITPADVRGNYQELFCGEDGSGSEEDLQYFHHALCFQKMEAVLPDMYSAGAGADVDIVLTTREFARLVRAEHIAPALLTEEAFDSPLGESTGAGVIFGVTGGVMEAALRTAYYCVEGVNPPPDTFSDVRGFEGRKEASFTLGGKKLRTCTVSGLKNARDLMEDIRSGAVHYDFVEVMACPGGCVGGGGQPILDGVEMADVRGPKLYKLDSQRPLRFSHDNPEIIKLYEEYLEKPLGEKSHHLLHTHG